jgi:hypothetical protein
MICVGWGVDLNHWGLGYATNSLRTWFWYLSTELPHKHLGIDLSPRYATADSCCIGLGGLKANAIGNVTPVWKASQRVSAGLAASLTRAPIEAKRSPFLRPAVRMCGSAAMLRDGSEIPS